MSIASTEKPLCWGVIGAGKISHDFVLALHYSQRPHKVVAVAAASTVERAQDFCQKLGLTAASAGGDTKAYGSYLELIKDPNVDVVYVGNLNGAHCEWTLKALEAGKHVLCEKAFAVNAQQVRAMVSMARAKGLFLMEAFWSRFFPSWRKLREIVESCELGQAKFASANLCFNMSPRRKDLPNGECPLLDVGCYAVMFAFWVFPGRKVLRVECSGEKDANGCDVWANITVHFDGGVHAMCYYNSTVRNSCAASVTFERGELVIPERCFCATKLWRLTAGEKPGPDLMEFPLPDEAPLAKERTSILCGASATFNNVNSVGLSYEADHVFDCIHAEKTESEVMPLSESVSIMEVLDEVRHQLGVKMPSDNDAESR